MFFVVVFFVAMPAVLSARLVKERVIDLCRLHIDSVEMWRKRDATLPQKPSEWLNLVSFSFLLFFFCRIHCKLCPGHGEAAAACCVGLLRGPEAAFHDPVSRNTAFSFFFWQMKPARNEKVVLSCTFPCRERANMQQ